GSLAEAGHSGGRDDHFGTELNEEPERDPGPGDAADEEGQPVVLRDEGPRGKRPAGPGAHARHDGRGTGRHQAVAGAGSWGGDRHLRGRGLPESTGSVLVPDRRRALPDEPAWASQGAVVGSGEADQP